MTRTIFTAGLATETNTFSPIPTGMGLYEATFLVRPPEALPGVAKMETAVAWAAQIFADGHDDWQVVHGTYAWAEPAGLTVRTVHETLRDEILDQLRAAMPVDVVALGLHGAMVAEGCDDCEGDLLARVREIVGPDVPVGAELDLHCHLTAAMTEAADVMVMYKEYPHIDFAERGIELIDMLTATAEGRIKPHMAVYDCRLIDTYHTTSEPMRSMVDRIQAMEGQGGVLSVSLGHGFPYGDVADLGTRVLVVTDGDKAKAAVLAEALGQELIAMRGKGAAPHHSIDRGLALAREVNGGTVVLADGADNPGGGAPCDSTFVLRALIDEAMTDACVGPIWDPIAVSLCRDAGAGAVLDLRLGGKIGPMSGDPLDLRVTVLAINETATQTFGGAPDPLGCAVALRTDHGIELLVCDRRTQAFGPDLFTSCGIDPAAKRYVIVKSNQHFHAGFVPLAQEILYLDAPGALPRDVTSLDFEKRPRPLWPFEEI
jgi:microcystin degradation protein MlrC